MTHELSVTYVGIDVSKDKLAVAVADWAPGGEVVSWSTFENALVSVHILLRKIAKRAATVAVCYEAGPTGYGLYRQVRAFGFECSVVAYSLFPMRADPHGKWQPKISPVAFLQPFLPNLECDRRRDRDRLYGCRPRLRFALPRYFPFDWRACHPAGCLNTGFGAVTRQPPRRNPPRR